jgi:catecholate siderophore receptor
LIHRNSHPAFRQVASGIPIDDKKKEDDMAYNTRLRPVAAAVAAIFGSIVPGMALSQAAVPSQAVSPDTALPEVNVTGSSPRDDYAPGVTSVGRVPTPIRDVPQTVTVINRAVMEAQGATSLADTLRSVPGITLGAAEGGSIGNNFNLRGFSARTDLYLDGMRDRGQVYRDVFSLDSVEVLKGASSMLFGRGATGGVINQVSKAPSRTPLNEASVTAGTQPSLRVTADVNQPLGEDAAFRIAVMGQNVNSTRDVMENKDYGIAPSLKLGIGTPTEITLSGLFTHNRDMPDYGLPPVNGRPADVDRHNFYGLTDDRTIQDVGQFTAKISHKLSADTTLQNQTRFARYLVDARESGPNSVGTRNGAGVYTAFPATNTANNTALPASQLFVGLGSHDRQITDSALYNQTDLITRFDTGGIKHELLAGLELGQDENRVRNSSRNTGGNAFFTSLSLENPERISGADLPSVAGNEVKAKARTFAPYINDTISLSQQWKVVAGVRHDRYSADLTNSVNAPASASQSVSYNSVRSGLIFQPSLAQSYYVSYGTSFNPSLEALTLTTGQQSLEPETNKSYELGGKWDLKNGDLSLSSAVFQTDKSNARSQVSPGVFELTGDVRVRGFEAGAAGRITRRWQVLAGYTYLDPKIVKASSIDATQGNTLANTPRHSTSLWTTYNVTPEWEVGTGVSYMSERFANNNNAVKVPDYVRWDATVAYHKPKYDIRLNVLNLTNRTNYEQLIPSDRGRSVPGMDRTALLTLTYRY